MLKYARVKAFYALLDPLSAFTRRRRTDLFLKAMRPGPSETILDVGGTPQIWDHVKTPLNVTCLNLPGSVERSYDGHHRITFVEGDGCSMSEFRPGQFDLIFSNSVIEHVGDEARRKSFADEIRRLSNRYWVQTPHRGFPIEAHCGMPFWWFYPEGLRAHFIRQWKKKLPAWTSMVEGTSIVTKAELRALFPGSRIGTEWLIFPKSLIAYAV